MGNIGEEIGKLKMNLEREAALEKRLTKITKQGGKNVKEAVLKLDWQGQSNTLIYLFRQLKENVNKDNRPLITNSYEEIAQHLQSTYSCFKGVKISTITGQLKKTSAPKKANKRIELFI